MALPSTWNEIGEVGVCYEQVPVADSQTVGCLHGHANDDDTHEDVQFCRQPLLDTGIAGVQEQLIHSVMNTKFEQTHLSLERHWS